MISTYHTSENLLITKHNQKDVFFPFTELIYALQLQFFSGSVYPLLSDLTYDLFFFFLFPIVFGISQQSGKRKLVFLHVQTCATYTEAQ